MIALAYGTPSSEQRFQQDTKNIYHSDLEARARDLYREAKDSGHHDMSLELLLDIADPNLEQIREIGNGLRTLGRNIA